VTLPTNESPTELPAASPLTTKQPTVFPTASTNFPIAKLTLSPTKPRNIVEVTCGGHSAPSCAECPNDNGIDRGQAWCNGDCRFMNNQCITYEEAGNIVVTGVVVSCGGHSAPSCAECPNVNGIDRGQGWCNGVCFWNFDANICEDVMPPNQVSCGGHSAPSCTTCPYDGYKNFMGEGWCNGDCRFTNNQCFPTSWSTLTDEQQYFVERKVLDELFESCGGINWYEKYTPNHCEWKIVECRTDRIISKLDLWEQEMTGTIPEAIGNLTGLVELILYNNKLTGTIPNIYRKLLSIKEIDLSNNNFQGILTANIFDAVNIEKINLSGNMLNGNLTSLSARNLRNLKLKELILGNNCFFGELPPDLVDTMPKLSVLDLSHNDSNCETKIYSQEECTFQFHDYVCCNESDESAEQICSKDWDVGADIILNQAGLWGSLPPEYVKFTYMEELDLSGNSLYGNIPLEYVKFGKQKIGIKLGRNDRDRDKGNIFFNSDFGSDKLTGLAALDICRQACHVFDVTKNEEVCPKERTALADVFAKLKLDESDWGTEDPADDNYYYRGVEDDPFAHCNWNYINCIDGKIQNITLTSMTLSGSISSSIGILTHLEVLNLRDNQIIGSIPPEIGELIELRQLILAHNRIQGNIPNNMSNLTNLELLQLNANRLEGKVPDEIQVNSTIFNISSFTSDCGYPSFFPDSLECKKCLVCCNSMEECTSVVKKYEILYPSIVALVFILFYIICLPKIGSFLNFVNYDAVIMEDVLKKIGTDSVYIFVLSKNWILNLLAATVVIVQVIVFVFFLLASTFKADVESDWKYTWECPINQTNCMQDRSQEKWIISMAIAILIIFIFTGRDFFSGSWTIIFCNRLQKGKKKILIFVVGAVLITTSFLSFVISVFYLIITTSKTTEVIVSSVIILFINTLDEEVFALLEKLYPDSVKEEIESIKLLCADVTQSNQNDLEDHNFSSREGDEINDKVQVEIEDEIWVPMW